MPKKLDLTGQIFGIIKCISPAESKGKKTYWNCQCTICGFEKIIQTTHLRNGSIKTCGCGCQLEITNERQDVKFCEICGKEFVPITYGQTRKYCYECSPTDKTRAEQITVLRKAMKKQAVKIKGGKCEKCGYDKCIAVLQFHHINPKEKSFGLSENGIFHSWDKYLEEVNKCELLCSNCHIETHNM